MNSLEKNTLVKVFSIDPKEFSFGEMLTASVILALKEKGLGN